MSGKIRVGVIGAGLISEKAHLPAWSKLADVVEIVAVSDLKVERAEAAAAKFGVPRAVSDFRQLLEIDEIDAVSVCTPPVAHSDVTIAALEAGKHVVCEKPMAIDLPSAEAMVAASEKTDKKLAIQFQSRFHPAAQVLKKMIEDGDLGDIYYANAVYHRRRGIPGWGTFHSRAHNGGGALIDVGVHALDMALWLSGHPKPVAVFGSAYSKFGKRTDIYGALPAEKSKEFDVDDSAFAMIKFANGATLNLECSWALNIDNERQKVVLAGEQGGAELHPLRVFKDSPEMLIDIVPSKLEDPDFPALHAMAIEDFARAIQEDRDPLVTVKQALMVSQIVDAVYRSQEDGGMVSLSE